MAKPKSKLERKLFFLTRQMRYLRHLEYTFDESEGPFAPVPSEIRKIAKEVLVLCWRIDHAKK